MSMPSFPSCGANITKDEALAMIIASIAMEELALSHIVNAEGEKLQYVLGTLPGGQRTCANMQEILAVNKSATELLNTVMQCQILLKGKMEKALEAGGWPVPPPGPPCPSPPPCPVEPPCPAEPPCPEQPARPCQPCSGCGPCGRKSAIRLVNRSNGFVWNDGFLLAWKCQGVRGTGVHWNKETPALVNLDAGRAYTLHYTVNIRGARSGDSAGAILVRLRPCDAFSAVLPLYFSINGSETEPMTLHYSTVLFPALYPASCADLSLLLSSGGSLLIEQASLDIVEI